MSLYHLVKFLKICETVVAAILEIMTDTTSRFHRASLGIGQPDTHYAKPSFY